MSDRLNDARFDALRNAVYHAARWRFIDAMNRVLSLVVVAAGTAAVGDLGAALCINSKWLAAVGALAGLLQLVFDLGSKARTHEFLQRRFYEIIADMAVADTSTEKTLASFDAALSRLYAEEPPPVRARSKR